MSLKTYHNGKYIVIDNKLYMLLAWYIDKRYITVLLYAILLLFVIQMLSMDTEKINSACVTKVSISINIIITRFARYVI
jgi:hypothetical protein